MFRTHTAIASGDLIRSKSNLGHSFWRSLFESMAASRRRQAEMEIAQYLGGTKFNGDLAREIERRFLSTSTH